MNNFFSHDSNARNSDKLIPLRASMGAEGYGIYFMILERLREEPNYTSVKDYNMLAFDLRVSADKVKKVIENFGLFVFTDDGKHFYSEGFMRRMQIKDQQIENAKKAAEIRWVKEREKRGKCDGNADAMRAQCERNARKEKKRKVNISSTTTTARENLDDSEDSVNDFSATPEKGCAEKVPPQVPPGTYSLVPIGELAAWMKSESAWIEQLCINRHKDPEYIKRKIDEFAAHCASNGETAKDKDDCKRHFNNWLRKVEQQPATNYSNGKRTYKTEPPSVDELDRAVAEGWARAHTRQEWE